MSVETKKGSSTKTPTANDLDVYDPNTNLPSEPPPSYDEAMADPSIPTDDNNIPEVTPPQPQRPSQPPPKKYSRPTVAPPQHPSRPSGPPPVQQDHSTLNLPKPTPINPNPYLPWRYPSSYRCSKCENTGFKIKNGHACKRCWGRFRPQTIPPSSQAELERLVKHKPAPKPINSNVVKLPPGAAVIPTSFAPAPRTQAPVVVQPGDPRIGGILCPRCSGRGMVHFFLDLERCPQCNGLGRVAFNGRPL